MLSRNQFRKIVTTQQLIKQKDQQNIFDKCKYYYSRLNINIIRLRLTVNGKCEFQQNGNILVKNTSLVPIDPECLDDIYHNLDKFHNSDIEKFFCIIIGTNIFSCAHAQCLLFDKKNKTCELFNSGSRGFDSILYSFIQTQLLCKSYKLKTELEHGIQGKDYSCFLWALAYPWLRITFPEKTLNDIYSEITSLSIQQRREILYKFMYQIFYKNDNFFFVKRRRCC